MNEKRTARVVHYAFGSSMGGLFGLVAVTFPSAVTLKGGLAFGLAVWVLGDDILLPSFKLAAWPQHHPLKTHLYAIGAHMAYGAATSACFAGIVRSSTPVTALLGSLYLTRNVPKLLRPPARRLAKRGLRVAIPVRRVATTLNGLSRKPMF